MDWGFLFFSYNFIDCLLKKVDQKELYNSSCVIFSNIQIFDFLIHSQI